jgi:RMI1, N-terminal OB-fold domain/Recq-mediated genome instability protein 1, C-terminal OB-fold/RMI1, N-terminal helical domain
MIHSAKQYLGARHVLARDDWLSACVQFIESNGNNGSSTSRKCKQVYDYILTSDLRTSGRSRSPLPAQLCSAGAIGVKEFGPPSPLQNCKLFVQLHDARDVSMPRLQKSEENEIQLEHEGDDGDDELGHDMPSVENNESVAAAAAAAEELEKKSRANQNCGANGGRCRRTLQLALCDGERTIVAIEFDPLPELDGELFPGTKFLIDGAKVVVRRGLVLLTAGSLVKLGGHMPEPEPNDEQAQGNGYQPPDQQQQPQHQQVSGQQISGHQLELSGQPQHQLELSAQYPSRPRETLSQKRVCHLKDIEARLAEVEADAFDVDAEELMSSDTTDVIAEASDVKAMVVSIPGGFKCNNNRFSMLVNIDDGTAVLQCAVSHAVLRDLLGMSAEQFSVYLETDAGRRLLKSSLASVAKRLQNAEFVMSISVAHSNRDCMPMIHRLRAPDADYARELLRSLDDL